MSIDQSDRDWAKSVAYELTAEGIKLTVDGVELRLQDARSSEVKWDAIGMLGIKTSVANIKLSSANDDENVFFSVLGKPVEVREGQLTWGHDSLGAAVVGDVFLVDSSGVHRYASE